jgi:hypothetical protein
MKVTGTIAMLFACMLLTSGCLENEPECDEIEDRSSTTIDEDQYYHSDLGSKVERIEYSFERSDDENHDIDVYTMTDINFEQYKDGHSFNYIVDLSNPATNSESFSKGPFNLESDHYHIVIDNTDSGSSAPPSDGVNNEVTFVLELKIYKCA